jgi:vacuolar-type H+-ATPase subunit F/Vma7
MEQTGLYFLGEAGLASGFRLAGFEVLADADQAALEQLLLRLREAREAAFVVLDQQLARSDSQVLREIRAEGGRILITQVPSLNNSEPLPSCVDAQLGKLFSNSLEADDP